MAEDIRPLDKSACFKYIDKIVDSLHLHLCNYQESIVHSRNTKANLKKMVSSYIQEEYSKKGIGLFVNGKLASIILYEQMSSPSDGWVFIQLCLTFEYFRRGRLMSKMIKWFCHNLRAKGITAVVNRKNTISRKLFHNNGFHIASHDYSRRLIAVPDTALPLELKQLSGKKYRAELKIIIELGLCREPTLGAFILNTENIEKYLDFYLGNKKSAFTYGKTEFEKILVALFCHFYSHPYGNFARLRYCYFSGSEVDIVGSIRFMEDRVMRCGHDSLGINIMADQMEIGEVVISLGYQHVHDIFIKIL